MAKHRPSILYCTHKFGVYPNASICTVNKTALKIAIFPENHNGFAFAITRSLAKMLARRINQCLEDTK